MEKYYLIGTALLTIAFNVPGYATDHFGWDETSSSCWYKSPSKTTRLHWIIATETFPQTLAASIEIVCSCILLVYMYLVQVR
jgi:hypothetical protein